MVYVIVDSQSHKDVFLVKAEDIEEVEVMVKLTPTQRIVGTFTNAELHTLESSAFAMIKG